MSTEPAVKVIFRTFTDKTREVLAVFPELPSNRLGHHCTFYAQVGQHGGGDRHALIRITRPATEAEAAPLRKELERIGYILQECRRITPQMDRTRMADARRVYQVT